MRPPGSAAPDGASVSSSNQNSHKGNNRNMTADAARRKVRPPPQTRATFEGGAGRKGMFCNWPAETVVASRRKVLAWGDEAAAAADLAHRTAAGPYPTARDPNAAAYRAQHPAEAQRFQVGRRALAATSSAPSSSSSSPPSPSPAPTVCVPLASPVAPTVSASSSSSSPQPRRPSSACVSSRRAAPSLSPINGGGGPSPASSSCRPRRFLLGGAGPGESDPENAGPFSPPASSLCSASTPSRSRRLGAGAATATTATTMDRGDPTQQQQQQQQHSAPRTTNRTHTAPRKRHVETAHHRTTGAAAAAAATAAAQARRLREHQNKYQY